MPGGKIVRLVLAALLVAVLVAFFMLELLGFDPEEDIQDIFPKGKETLLRYYACSLAICTHGCEDESITERICLDNDTYTHECNLWCDEECKNKDWVCNGAGDCCGPEYNLSVSLGDASFGCYPHYAISGDKKNEGHSDVYNHLYVKYDIGERTLYDKLIETEGFPKIIGPFDDSILDEGCAGKLGCAGDPLYMKFPGQLRTVEGWDTFHDCLKIGKAGIGYIYLDSVEAYEKYGCSGDCSMYTSGGDINSFDYCRFQGEINIWSDWQKDGCADVRFNSTIGGYWWFDIWCADPPIIPPELRCERKISPDDETAEYTLNIENQLGSGREFILATPPEYTVENANPPDANPGCTFWKDDQMIDRIFVRNTETEDFIMKCKPTGTGTYTIKIDATPSTGKEGRRTEAKLVVSDFSLGVSPIDKKISKCKSQIYTVWIDSDMGRNADFTLSLNVPGGLTCNFDDVSSWDDVPDDGHRETTFTCSGTPEDYTITITATADGISDGISKSTTSGLEILDCRGAIALELIPNEVSSGDEFDARAYNLIDCNDKRVEFAKDTPESKIGFCDIVIEDGSECTLKDIDVTFPVGEYDFYALIDMTCDNDYDDPGEETSGKLTVATTIPPPPPCTDHTSESECTDAGCYWCGECDGYRTYTPQCVDESSMCSSRCVKGSCGAECSCYGYPPAAGGCSDCDGTERFCCTIPGEDTFNFCGGTLDCHCMYEP